MKIKEDFGSHLMMAAGQRNYSLTSLASKAGVHLSNLSNIASNKRPCGLAMAVRLADAIDLWGPDRMHFLQLASKTTARKTTAQDKEHVFYPAALRDLVAQVLSTKHIFPGDIAAVETSRSEGLPIIRLKNGQRIKLQLTMTDLPGSSRPRNG